MWDTDYPHPEGSWPHTAKRLQTDFRDLSIEDTRRLLGLNAVDCCNLDLPSLIEIADRVGPTPSSSTRTPAFALRPTSSAPPADG